MGWQFEDVLNEIDRRFIYYRVIAGDTINRKVKKILSQPFVKFYLVLMYFFFFCFISIHCYKIYYNYLSAESAGNFYNNTLGCAVIVIASRYTLLPELLPYDAT